MAIDTSKIEGYSEMTAEEKISALENFEFELPKAPADSGEMSKLRSLLSKANSEAKSYKDQLREKMSEQERLEAERAENERAMREELDTYKAKDRISNYTKKLANAGYDIETASAMANGLPDGIPDNFFEQQRQFLENQKKVVETSALNKQLNLTPGSPLQAVEIEDAQIAAFRRAAMK